MSKRNDVQNKRNRLAKCPNDRRFNGNKRFLYLKTPSEKNETLTKYNKAYSK